MRIEKVSPPKQQFSEQRALGKRDDELAKGSIHGRPQKLKADGGVCLFDIVFARIVIDIFCECIIKYEEDTRNRRSRVYRIAFV